MAYPKIYLMRHGQTEWNLARRMQGHLDSPLTEKGQAQAVDMGKILKREIADPQNYDMFTSPLGRTLHTSKLVAQNFAFAPTNDDLLMEINAGSWGGTLWADIERDQPEAIADKSMPRMCCAPDGESYEDLLKRGKQWLDSLNGQCIVVSHGQIGFVIRAIYTGLTYQDVFKLGNSQDGVFLLENGQESFLTA